ncbi:MAG: bacteriohemerythrin [Gammaproteobacteria bacterium]|nr:bacteriohemerythrin [Gammaproteobacteria bacterium]MBU1777090.1 bacteriohemerythrin [Gammaproteobacteria bacterium]MBU1968111.1 bacteriohemerythrin [Gammaproteobacteria bacterium]
MESFVWDEHFVTGLAEVDKQHHRLVDVINQFGDLLTQPENIPFDKVETVFGELAAYAQYHFAEEEMLMDTQKVDQRHVHHHKHEHVNFLQEVTQLHAAISPQKPEKAKSLLNFLIYWLAYHILGSDQSMAKQVKAIRDGQTAAEAYRAEERMKEGAVEPLLHALNGLFRQVSERNRELLQLNQTLETRVTERTAELAVVNRQLEEMALTDVLTGLPNRRHAMRRLEQVWKESTRNDLPLACMMIDADGFKQVNDNFGHDAGDEVLRQLSRNLSYTVRNDDIVCRLGGDEFLVICPRTPLEGARQLADKLCREVASMRVRAGSGEWRGSVSIGVAARNAGMDNFEALIKAADEGVYCAKKNGRGCVAVAP